MSIDIIDNPNFTDDLIKFNSDCDWIRFEVTGYKPGTEEKGVFYSGARDRLNEYDPGKPDKYESVKAFLIVNDSLEIELTDEQALSAFSCYKQEFFNVMYKRFKKEIKGDL